MAKCKLFLILLSTSSFFIGCATYDKEITTYNKLSMEMFNGDYEVKISEESKLNLFSILDILYREESVLPKFDFEKEFRLRINLISDDSIQMTLFEKDSFMVRSNKVITKNIKIKSTENNQIFLKNSNYKRHNIPFILGGFDVLKTRLKFDDNGNLIIDSVSKSYGALLFFIWSGKPTMHYSTHYKRITGFKD
jgi:hypothetical protein